MMGYRCDACGACMDPAYASDCRSCREDSRRRMERYGNLMEELYRPEGLKRRKHEPVRN